MPETSQEERDAAKAVYRLTRTDSELADIAIRALNDADRLAEIEREIEERATAYEHSVGGCAWIAKEHARELRAIIYAPDAGD